MPYQNRVQPTADIVSTEARGTLMGNRGIIHDPDTKTLLDKRWAHQSWVFCRLEYGNRHRTIMGRGTYTELFFLDEATALAAGHRPCGTCRRKHYRDFRAAWLQANHTGHCRNVSIQMIDRRLHKDRVDHRRRQVRHSASLEDLPFGTMFLLDMHPCLVHEDHLLPWTNHGYGKRIPKRRQFVTVLTPRSIVASLRSGYRPIVHCSVR